MGDVTLAMSVFMRDDSGRFAERIDRAGEELMERLSDVGADISRELAPVGQKPDPRTKKLKDSITSSHTATSAKWQVTARHANIIEEGSDVRPQIPGRVNFYWEAEGRRWVPGDNIIDHPPTAAQPYMHPAWETVMETWDDYAREYYPQ